ARSPGARCRTGTAQRRRGSCRTEKRRKEDVMLLGVVLLYVGAVLVVNGIWLLGQAAAAEREASGTRRSRAEREAGEETLGGAGEPGAGGAAVAQLTTPIMIRNREVAILNVFTGFIGIVSAIVLAAQGNEAGDLGSVRAAGYI